MKLAKTQGFVLIMLEKNAGGVGDLTCSATHIMRL